MKLHYYPFIITSITCCFAHWVSSAEQPQRQDGPGRQTSSPLYTGQNSDAQAGEQRMNHNVLRGRAIQEGETIANRYRNENPGNIRSQLQTNPSNTIRPRRQNDPTRRSDSRSNSEIHGNFPYDFVYVDVNAPPKTRRTHNPSPSFTAPQISAISPSVPPSVEVVPSRPIPSSTSTSTDSDLLTLAHPPIQHLEQVPEPHPSSNSSDLEDFKLPPIRLPEEASMQPSSIASTSVELPPLKFDVPVPQVEITRIPENRTLPPLPCSSAPPRVIYKNNFSPDRTLFDIDPSSKRARSNNETHEQEESTRLPKIRKYLQDTRFNFNDELPPFRGNFQTVDIPNWIVPSDDTEFADLLLTAAEVKGRK